MNRLAPAIRLRRRALDAIALRLAAGQAEVQALAGEASMLAQKRTVERHFAAGTPLSCDAWFAEGARRLGRLHEARAEAERGLAALREDAVQARARLQLLEEAAAEARRVENRRRLAKADAALDDRIAAGWKRR
jgi:hypothetical protein